MEKYITVNDCELNVKEPIIMRLIEEKKNFPLMEFQSCMLDNEFIIIENPSIDMYTYMETLMCLISDPCTGQQLYPCILNIDSNKAYEYFVIETCDIGTGCAYKIKDREYQIRCMLFKVSKEQIILKQI